jgi:hypothetical protein
MVHLVHRLASMKASVMAEEIEELLGDVAPSIIDRIIDTHATLEELVEAVADAEDEQRFGERRAPASLRIAELREIIEEVLEERGDDAR